VEGEGARWRTVVARQVEKSQLVLDDWDVADRECALWVLLLGKRMHAEIDGVREEHSLREGGAVRVARDTRFGRTVVLLHSALSEEAGPKTASGTNESCGPYLEPIESCAACRRRCLLLHRGTTMHLADAATRHCSGEACGEEPTGCQDEFNHRSDHAFKGVFCLAQARGPRPRWAPGGGGVQALGPVYAGGRGACAAATARRAPATATARRACECILLL
jgi:hypothetical protein